MKSRLIKYIENFTTKKWKKKKKKKKKKKNQIKNSDNFPISAQNIDCWYSLLCFRNLSESRFCLALYTEEANLQRFVMIKYKTICRIYICTNSFI